MKMISVHRVNEDDRLAKTIYDEDGQPLLKSGVTLTSRLLQRLKDKGISFIYIEEEGTEDIFASDTIDPIKRAKSIKSIKHHFEGITKMTTLQKVVNLDSVSSSFSSIVNTILDDIYGKKEAVSLLSDVICYDSYVFHHSLNVTIYALSLGKELGLGEKDLHKLGMGAILHDVGKVGIPETVLNKQESLTDEEFNMIKEHTTVGFDMIRRSHTMSLLTAHCAYQHHERINGTGYPRQLKGNEIHDFAKIIGIVDVFDAVTSNRVYRGARLPHEGLEMLYSGASTLFDKRMVEVFAHTVAIYPVGLEVTLSDGSVGVVVETNKNMPSRPRVRVLSRLGQPIQPIEIDLADTLNVTITEAESIKHEQV
ncbi:HD-GYP domain-containing protein [Paenalkalicoccus suaedae]|uniref:HD-GYP domain-containing protein n=1 Tax=Paenalkalicoccus suaedae TaxID=2592382 RepID=A0A859FHD1_9BACI|nr:HD-GYP domain-containing protein [Paenalkalicoccus suaedae]QKS72200.1 HD-GYP domain-containing protein [Paenalkalicoccus suaedae]